ncbi:dihydrodipicolinate synthase family protein, partial [Rhodospirillaceae bacterium]|nr:dihydrodipicolinate synthase family protein [Rhodospirillaceae bacterium]
LIRRANPRNLIFSAVDALLFSSYQLGAPGAIAAILTAAPGPSVNLWNAVIEEEWDTARDLHERLMPLWDAIGVDNMPSLCKYAQQLQGVETGHARKPTSPATDEQKKTVRIALENLKLI